MDKEIEIILNRHEIDIKENKQYLHAVKEINIGFQKDILIKMDEIKEGISELKVITAVVRTKNDSLQAEVTEHKTIHSKALDGHLLDHRWSNTYIVAIATFFSTIIMFIVNYFRKNQ